MITGQYDFLGNASSTAEPTICLNMSEGGGLNMKPRVSGFLVLPPAIMQLLSIVVATLVPLAVWTSGLPSLTGCFNCPPEDLAGKPLNTTSTTLEELICYYEIFPVQTCRYSRVSDDLPIQSLSHS